MIKTFFSKHEFNLFNNIHTKKIPSALVRITKKKMVLIHVSTTVEDLRIPPSNHLEKLSGNRKGQYSIRINRSYRLCFNYKNGNAYNIEFVDYH